jgi:hypothetical protein
MGVFTRVIRLVIPQRLTSNDNNCIVLPSHSLWRVLFVFLVVDLTFSAGCIAAARQQKAKSWSNVDAVMRGDLFRAAHVAYQHFETRNPTNKIEDYNVEVGYGSNGIMVVFQLRFSESRKNVLGGSYIEYWIDEKTFAVKSINYEK